MADKRLNDLSIAPDGAYIYAEDASGNQIKIAKADLATVVAGILNPLTYKGWTSDIDANDLQMGIVYGGSRLTNFPVASSCYIVTIGTGDRVQFAFPAGATMALYMRKTQSGSWLKWKQVQFV